MCHASRNVNSTDTLEVLARTDEIASLAPRLLAPRLLAPIIFPSRSIPVVRWAAEDSLGRNGSTGIRTRHTKVSDAAWAAGHTAALPVLRKMSSVAAVGLPTAAVVQVLGGGYTGTAVAAVALVPRDRRAGALRRRRQPRRTRGHRHQVSATHQLRF